MKYLKTYDNKNTYDKNFYDKNLKNLKNYARSLENVRDINKMLLNYAIILHNFILIEKVFYNIINKAGISFNDDLHIVETNSTYWINMKLIELYNPEHEVRNKIERFDDIPEIDEILSSNPDIYNTLYTEDQIRILAETKKFNL